MSSVNIYPYLILQSDWELSLNSNQPGKKAWVQCKKLGAQSIYGELKTTSGEPGITSSDGFTANIVKPRQIKVQYTDPNCQCLFIAPLTTFQSIHQKSVVDLDVSRGGLGVSVCTDNKLLVWETSHGVIRRDLEGHVGDVYTCRFFPSGLVVLSGGADMQLKVWSVETGECPVTFRGHTQAITDSAIVDRGRNVISVSRDGSAKLWNCGTASCLDTLINVETMINSCCLQSTKTVTPNNDIEHSEHEVSTEDKLLALACEDGNLTGVAVHSRTKVFSLKLPAAVNACSFLSENEVLCGTQEGQIGLLDVRQPSELVSQWQYSTSPVNSILSIYGGFITSQNDGVCMYRTTNTEDMVQLTGPDCDPVYKVVSDGKKVYTCCRDGKIRNYIYDS